MQDDIAKEEREKLEMQEAAWQRELLERKKQMVEKRRRLELSQYIQKQMREREERANAESREQRRLLPTEYPRLPNVGRKGRKAIPNKRTTNAVISTFVHALFSRRIRTFAGQAARSAGMAVLGAVLWLIMRTCGNKG